jgi:hypothetical protein
MEVMLLKRLLRGWRVMLVGALLMSGVFQAAAATNSLVFCAQPAHLTAAQKDRLLIFGSVVRDVLEQSGRSVAIVSRSGIDLDRFSIRYSHSGISLKNSPNTPWSVRQLYYACDAQKAKIFDQGLAGFVMDFDGRDIPFLSLVFVPELQGSEMINSALDSKLALSLLDPHYSGNAYAFSTIYQNCNQWVVEMLAHAWGHLDTGGDARGQAQQWLKDQHYQPTEVDVKHGYMVWLTHLVPLLHNDDHPADNLARNVYQVSMPGSIESFVRSTLPGSSRVEVCMNQTQVVVHHGWDALPDQCIAGAGDEVIPLS